MRVFSEPQGFVPSPSVLGHREQDRVIRIEIVMDSDRRLLNEVSGEASHVLLERSPPGNGNYDEKPRSGRSKPSPINFPVAKTTRGPVLSSVIRVMALALTFLP